MPSATSIRSRLLILTAAVVLPLSSVIGYGVYSQFRTDRERALQELRLVQAVNQHVLESYVEGARQELAWLAQDPRIQAMGPEGAINLMNDFTEAHADAYDLRLLDGAGRIIAAVKPLASEQSDLLADLPAFRRAGAAPGFSISPTYHSPVFQRWTCLFSHPVLDEAGGRIGTIAMPLNLSRIIEMLNRPAGHAGMSVVVVDHSGVVVVRVPEGENFPGSQIQDAPWLTEALEHGVCNDFEWDGLDGRRRVAVAGLVKGSPWVVVASVPTDEILASAWARLWRIVSFIGPIFALGAYLITRFAKKIEDPILALARVAREQAAGHTDRLADTNGPQEIAETARAFNDMLDARRRAESHLVENEERYRTVIDQTGQIIYDLDLATNAIRWFGTEATPAITGCALGAFQSVNFSRWEEMIHPDDRAQATALFEKNLAERTPYHAEYRFRHKDGSYRHIEDHGVFVCDAQGKPERLLGRMSDVTARRLTSLALAESEHRYRTVIDQTGQMIYDLDYATNTARWFGTEATPAITGYTLDEFQGVNLARWEEMVHPEDRAHAIAAMDRSLAERELYHVEYRFRHKDGSYRHIEDHGIFLFNADGSPKRWIGRLGDVTARHLALAALVENELRYRTVIDQTGQMIYDLDVRTGEVRWFGEAATGQILGCTPEEFSQLGIDGWRDRLHPEDREAAVARLEHSLQTGEPCRAEYRLRHRDGSYRFVVERGAVLRNADGVTHRMVGRLNDVTERRKIEEERRQLETKILHTQKLESLGVLAGGIAHDFNNLLTGILGHASLARLDLPPSSSVRPCLEHIDTAARRAAELCNQMLAYSGKGRFVVQRLDLNQLVTETTHLLNISISKTSLLRFNPTAGLPAVMADATQMRQVVMNLVINASEAIGNRSGVIAIGTGVARVDRDYLLTLRHSKDLVPGDYVFLEVSDNGHGMDASTIDRIFDPFFTTKFTGRGLGLAAVLGIIRGHKGAIKIYSEAGRGTTFKVFFPCADGPAETALFSGATTDDAPLARGSGHVLVVDDEETIRTVVARMLELLGYTIETANDGREAVEKFRADPARYQLVLLDLTMPHLDGEETFRQLRHLNPGVRVVLMSGFNEQEAISRFTGKGLAGFVQKPFEVATLAAVVRAVTLAG